MGTVNYICYILHFYLSVTQWMASVVEKLFFLGGTQVCNKNDELSTWVGDKNKIKTNKQTHAVCLMHVGHLLMIECAISCLIQLRL